MFYRTTLVHRLNGIYVNPYYKNCFPTLFPLAISPSPLTFHYLPCKDIHTNFTPLKQYVLTNRR